MAVGCFFPGSDSAVGLLSPLERFAYDWRVRARASESVDPSIVIVAVDEKSLDEEGRWPWSRRRIGELTATLFDDYKIKLLGLDILFPKETQQPVLDAVRQHARQNSASPGAPSTSFSKRAVPGIWRLRPRRRSATWSK